MWLIISWGSSGKYVITSMPYFPSAACVNFLFMLMPSVPENISGELILSALFFWRHLVFVSRALVPADTLYIMSLRASKVSPKFID